MRWILNSALLPALLYAGCTGKTEKRPFQVIRFEAFLTREAKQQIPSDSTQYLILEPDLCVSCVAYQIRQIAGHASKQPLRVVATPDQVNEVRKYTADLSGTRIFISDFDRRKLARQLYLKSGLADAWSYQGQVHAVVPVDHEYIDGFAGKASGTR